MKARSVIGALMLALGLSVCTAQTVVLACDTTMSWGMVVNEDDMRMVPDSYGNTRTLERVETGALLRSKRRLDREGSLKTGSGRTRRACGPVSFQFSLGFFNADPMGEMGGEDFAVLEAWVGGRRVLGPL